METADDKWQMWRELMIDSYEKTELNMANTLRCCMYALRCLSFNLINLGIQLKGLIR